MAGIKIKVGSNQIGWAPVGGYMRPHASAYLFSFQGEEARAYARKTEVLKVFCLFN